MGCVGSVGRILGRVGSGQTFEQGRRVPREGLLRGNGWQALFRMDGYRCEESGGLFMLYRILSNHGRPQRRSGVVRVVALLRTSEVLISSMSRSGGTQINFETAHSESKCGHV